MQNPLQTDNSDRISTNRRIQTDIKKSRCSCSLWWFAGGEVVGGLFAIALMISTIPVW
ncbi:MULTISPECIES: hypothetical protein [unclassified Nostoc]|uniref:hypothetical protein n=1 Tax=unclassified Nostoc TaxID=2593658 RepID=UPI001671C3FE|nr:hypothetical protein [Nostoc sp. 'Peltigera membranacea cyanobiont' 232]